MPKSIRAAPSCARGERGLRSLLYIPRYNDLDPFQRQTLLSPLHPQTERLQRIQAETKGNRNNRGGRRGN